MLYMKLHIQCSSLMRDSYFVNLKPTIEKAMFIPICRLSSTYDIGFLISLVFERFAVLINSCRYQVKYMLPNYSNLFRSKMCIYYSTRLLNYSDVPLLSN